MARFNKIKKYQNGGVINTKRDATNVAPFLTKNIKPIIVESKKETPLDEVLLKRTKAYLKKKEDNKAKIIKKREKRRKDLNKSINLIVENDNTPDKESLRKMLIMTSWMENRHGHDDDAYNSSYTNSQMQIDNEPLNDLLSKPTREDTGEPTGDYTDWQKSYFKKMPQYGFNINTVRDSLASDNSNAAMFMSRMHFAKVPDPMPTGDNYKDYYNYYKKYYNQEGTPTSEADMSRFKDGWDLMMKGEFNN